MPANKRLSSFLLFSALLFAAAVSACTARLGTGEENQPVDCSAGPGELFEQRVAPLLNSDQPDSCATCHASGVELSAFVRGDVCEAMACLQAEGLVDLQKPERSVLLSWIGRAAPQSELISSQVVQEEHDAFLEWFQYEAACQSCASVSCPQPAPSPCQSLIGDDFVFDKNTDSGACDDATLEQVFRGTIYKSRGRCSPCHFESAELATVSAPRFFADTGSCQTASLASMIRIIDSNYIRLERPLESPLLLKPLPQSKGGTPHGGHDKFSGPGDSGYDNFAYFLERYAACQK